jgi:hypothetical protein
MSTLESVIHVPPDVLFRELDGEAVILNVATGKYFGLNEMGARMWALLAEHGKVKPAYQALLTEFAVSADKLQHDLLKLVDDLATQGLVSIDPA